MTRLPRAATANAAAKLMTGLLYISPDSKDVHDQNETVPAPPVRLPHPPADRSKLP